MEGFEAYTEMAPGPELLRLEKQEDFVKQPFLGFGSRPELQHLWQKIDDRPYRAKCGHKEKLEYDPDKPLCPTCYPYREE